MDFGLREWLIIIGLLVIAGILFDGWRRMGGRSRIRFKLERNLGELPEPDNRDELLGPPRVVGRSDRAEPSLGDDLGDSTATLEATRREPEQVGLDLEEPAAGSSMSSKAAKPVKPEKPASKRKTDRITRIESMESVDEEPALPRDTAPVEEVFVINVIARDELGFQGSALLQNIMESGLRFGEMHIFHRHESMSGNGDILFSMANALKPGVFDLDEMDSSYVRAVSFFMGLPGPRHPKQALDLMIAAARKLAHELGGDLKDEQRSVLTAQTIEHYRARIAEYERKHYALRR